MTQSTCRKGGHALTPSNITKAGRGWRIDLAGQVFGYLVVVERDRTATGKSGGTRWWCKCEGCGQRISVRSDAVRCEGKVACDRRCRTAYSRSLWDEALNLADEEWRPVPFDDRYEVSNLGRVRSFVSVPPELLAPATGPDRYRIVNLGGKAHGVHRLVLIAFAGPPPFPRAQAAHRDGNPGNSRLENLRWATPQENVDDRTRRGTHHVNHLSDEAVIEIRRSGSTLRELAEKYSVSGGTIWKIRAGRSYKDVA